MSQINLDKNPVVNGKLYLERCYICDPKGRPVANPASGFCDRCGWYSTSKSSLPGKCK